VTTTTHKTLRGPRGGLILMKEQHAKAINSAIFPGIQGGPLMHVIAGKAIALKEASEPAFPHYQQQVITNADALAKTLIKRGPADRVGPHGKPRDAGRPAREEDHGQGRRESAR